MAPRVRFKRVKLTGRISLNFTRSIEHLQSDSHTQRACDEIGRLLYQWLHKVTEIDTMALDGKCVRIGEERITVKQTVVLDDTDDEAVTEALELTRSTEQAMGEAIIVISSTRHL